MEKPAFGIIVRNNLLILLAAAAVLGLTVKFIDESAISLFGLLYLVQALGNLLLALAHIGRGPNEAGPAPYLLRMLLVLIIGFGACSGIFMVAGSLGNMR